jgi:plastocyanin
VIQVAGNYEYICVLHESGGMVGSFTAAGAGGFSKAG